MALGFLAAVATGCGSSRGTEPDARASGNGASASCRPWPTEDPPALDLPQALPAPHEGEAWLSIDVPMALIEQEFERHVPRQLAAEKDRPIGAPGLVTYRVTRGRPKLRASAGKISVALPVQIDLSLCKPFGGLCIGYGSCTPAYDVKATWDLTLNAEHELPAVRLSQKVTEACRVGVDVTEHVTNVVREQLRDIEQRIADERPALAPWIDRAIKELTRATYLTVDQCVALAPSEILLDGPTTSGDHFSWAVGVRGTVAEVECNASPHRGRGLPVKRAEQKASSPTLEIRQRVTPDAFASALTKALERASKPELGLRLAQHELVRDGVAFSVDLSGSECGRVWVLAGIGVLDQRLALREVRVLASKMPPDRKAALEAALAVPLDLPSATPRLLEDLALEERTDILGTLLEAQANLELDVSAPAVLRAWAVTAPDGVWILSELGSRLHLQARAPQAP